MSDVRPTVLVVDDEDAMREVLALRLRPWGFAVAAAASGSEARALAESLAPVAVISDVVLPDVSGLELLRWLKAGDPRRPVILITAYGTIDAAVEAMKHGAQDFLTKPLDYARLRTLLAGLRRARSAAPAPPAAGGERGLGPLVGASAPMQALYRLIRTLAASQATAILTGESGTGKELVAHTIHQLSDRRRGPFVAVNTAAIPEGISEGELFGHEKGAFTGAVAARPGWFEQADGGTLLLDELVEMPLHLQPKLLRILEEGRVRRLGGQRPVDFDVRLLAATNRDPEEAVGAGRLRADLYYRLSVFTLHLPPLRSRGDDVLLLAEHFLERLNRKHGTAVEGFARETRRRLLRHRWPGNVRELKNAVERAVILAGEGRVRCRHLPPSVLDGRLLSEPGLHLPPGTSAAEAERILIVETLKRSGNNKAEAARRLGLDVKTIRNKLRRYARRPEPVQRR